MADTPAPTSLILVDGRNVQRSRWPNVSDAELVEALRAWAPPAECAVLFDGHVDPDLDDADGVRVVSTGRQSADDVLVGLTVRSIASGRTVRVATSDRALRARLERAGADVPWGGGRLLGVLGLAPPRGRRR